MTHRGVAHEHGRPTLEMQGVTVAYAAGVNGVTTNRGTDYALKDVSFQVSAGERIAVVGPNGAGKSTLFKLIVGTLKPSQGEVPPSSHCAGPSGKHLRAKRPHW